MELSFLKKITNNDLFQSMLALGIICVVTSFAVEETQIFPLSILLLLLNLFSSVQDIGVDSLAVNILTEHELGAGNTIQVVAYKAGSMFAGSLLLFVRESFGWTVMFLAFASIYFLAIFLLNLINISEKKTKIEKVENLPLKQEMWKLFQVKGTFWMMFFVLFYKLCERSEQSFALYLVDKKVAREELALLSTFIRAFSIIGSFLSGLILTKRTNSAKILIIIFAIIRAFGILGMTFVIMNWEPFDYSNFYKHLGYFCINLTSISAGGITTATFTLMMKVSQNAPENCQGTHYSLLATCEVLGKLLFAAVAGYMIDLYGLQIIFAFFTLLGFSVIPTALFAPNYVKED